ncbi:MAG: hypothetical protein IKK58_06725 [Clostridia bacterium]|nr:hypothetical protein [Clostridia bacterium]
MEYYKANRHFNYCGKYYIVLLALYALGISSGIWFNRLSETNVLCHSTVLLMLCRCNNVLECIAMQLGRLMLMSGIIFISYYYKILFWVGYITVFFIGVVFGAGVRIMGAGMLKLVFSVAMQLFQAVLIMYLVSVNSDFIFRIDGFSRNGICKKRIRILISVFLLLIMMVFISGILIININLI